MNEQIRATLKQLANEHQCRILFAVESGSRAWGFASPDSDYDIRAVYANPLHWYLQLDEKPTDTFTAQLPGDLDVSAWELRKALRQFVRCNVSFLEWLGSPIVYMDDGLIGELNALKQQAFIPEHAAHHYASMCQSALGNLTDDGSIGIKKLCYALRTALAVHWILDREDMPPTLFRSILEGVRLPAAMLSEIGSILERKESAMEHDRIHPSAELIALLKETVTSVESHIWSHQNVDHHELYSRVEDILCNEVDD